VRFLADGPSLPDELLIARDEGRVLFFCGAGVSQAQAGLPGFLGLAARVLKELRALPDSPARSLVDIATRLQKEPIKGVGGILAADRIFGLLERDFALADIERAVGRALKPQADTNLAAHRTLLDLSRGPNGDVQLVTTNFDLLFEAAAPKLPIWTPSQLPDLRRQPRFHGIVHLHGMFDDGYSKPVGGNLVLSSAEFGRAYLAEGWATAFIRAAIARYLIVFVGYTADDPPVQYLLEALKRVAEHPPRGLYAFQEGRESEAKALWTQKGVTAIAYTPDDHHAALWQTLAAWSERARDPNRWHDRLLQRAQRGPEKMLPHERGQIVHLAATADGARRLAESKKPIPATWLCVFDPASRYETPGKEDIWKADSLEVDPFALYGLDSDPEPPKAKESQPFKRREAPANVVDTLAPNALDAPAANTAGLRGERSNAIAHPPPRLLSLAVWFMRVSGQPAALWWVAGQKGLHPVMLRNVQFELDNKNSALTPVARAAWRYLHEAWRGTGQPDFMNVYGFQDRIARDGWSLSARREFTELLRPQLTVARPLGARSPTHKKKLRLHHLLRLDVDYSREAIHIEIPDVQLAALLPILRKSLEDASMLEADVSPFGLTHIPPIESDPNLPGQSADRDFGLNPYILKFAALFKKLAELDRAAALRELASWRRDDDPIFARLRLWAAGLPGLLDAKEVGAILTTVSDRLFWGDREQRDLLLVLSKRWAELSPSTLMKLERRLRRGLPHKRRYDPVLYPKWRAHSIAERLAWLKDKGCAFSFDVDAEIAAAQRVVPEWTAQDAVRAADSNEARSGGVHRDTSFESLLSVPLKDLIATALAAHERRHGFLQEHDPYAGLCEKRPVRVIAALMLPTEPSDDLRAAWTYFLNAGARRSDKAKIATLVARRLGQLPQTILSDIIRHAAWWLEVAAPRVFETDAEGARALFDSLMKALEHNPDIDLPPQRTPNQDRDWFNSANGSAVGHLTNVLVNDPSLKGIAFNTSLPDAWKHRADRLRALPDDHGRFCLLELAGHLDWFFARDPAWAEVAILAAMDRDHTDGDAAVAGFFRHATIGDQTLFNRLKPKLMTLATGDDRLRQHYEQVVAQLCITAWQQKNDAGERWFSDEELRTVLVYCSINMRTHMLWHVDRWPIEDKLQILNEVWPLQLVAKNAAVSDRLCAIAFDDEAHFPALVEAILPLLSPYEGGSLMLPLVRDRQSQIFERYPEQVLALLSVVLPSEGMRWPYGAGDVLDRLAKAAPILIRDSRFVDLRRRQTRSR
jgi:hypothetical protein